MNDTAVRREDARRRDGRFGEQEHTSPDVTLTAAPEYRSDHARKLDEQIDALAAQREQIMEARREEHLLDIARNVPAAVTRVVFRAEYDRDGEKSMLMFDYAEDERDMVTLDKALTEHLYTVAWDFGRPGDFAADNWMEGEDGHYWLHLDEDTALQYAHDFRNEMQAAQRTAGIAPLHLHHGHVAWTERAMRARAQAAGITEIHLHVPEDAAGVEVVGFRYADIGSVTVDDSDSDHMFLVGQAQQLPHRTEAMSDSGLAHAPLTLKV